MATAASEIDVLIIGECGSGKSTLINTLMGTEACMAGKTFHLNGMTREIQQYSVTLPMDVHSSMDEDSRTEPRPNLKNASKENEQSKAESKTGDEDVQNVDKKEDKAKEKKNKSTLETKSKEMEGIESRENHLSKEETEARKNEETDEKIKQFIPETKSEESEGMKSRKDHIAEEENEQRQNENETREKMSQTKSGGSEEVESKEDCRAKEETEKRKNEEADEKTQRSGNILNHEKITGGKESHPSTDNKENSFESLPEAKHNKTNLKENEKMWVNLYDTPVFDEFVAHFPRDKGFHAIALTFPFTRYTEERVTFIKKVCSAFDGALHDHIIIIFNKIEDQEGVKDLKKQIDDVEDHDKTEKVLSSIIENSGERCILFSKPAKNEEEQKLKLEFSKQLKYVLDHTDEPIMLKKR